MVHKRLDPGRGDDLFAQYWDAVLGKGSQRRDEVVAVAMLILAILNLIVLLSIYSKVEGLEKQLRGDRR